MTLKVFLYNHVYVIVQKIVTEHTLRQLPVNSQTAAQSNRVVLFGSLKVPEGHFHAPCGMLVCEIKMSLIPDSRHFSVSQIGDA